MKRIILSLLALIVPATLVFAQQPLFSIGNENVSADEFVKVYQKNNVDKESDFSESSLNDYLNLYINFRLKVKEAKDMKLDTASSVKNELASYRSTLAKSYLVDKSVTDKLVQEAYDRMKKDVRVSHILVKCDQNALPADTLKAWKKINAYYNLLKKGKDFATLARDSSDDPSAKENKGDLGYITSLQVVYPFENAAYSTPAGQISKPFRTKFGYHIVRVADVRPSRGTIQVEHIFVKLTKSMTHDDSLKAKQKIDDIYQKLQQGENFEELAKNDSEDKTSAADGGKLPAFGTGKMVMEFDNAAFALKNIGDYSKPIQTKYGWHIIKLIDKNPLPSFDEIKEELTKQVEKDSRGDLAKVSFVNKAKALYGYTENADGKKDLLNRIDSSLLKGLWKPDSAMTLSKTVFTLTDKTYSPEVKNYTQQELADFIEKNQRKYMSAGSKEAMFDKMFQQFAENSVLNFDELRLTYQYPAFADLMREYMDGILLFELTDQKVWSKAVKDTAGLKAFYETVKNNYPDDEKIKVEIYNCKNASVLSDLTKLKAKATSDNDIKTKINKKDPSNLSITEEIIRRPQFDTDNLGLEWKTGSSTTADGEGGAKKFTTVTEVIPVLPKPLEEVRGYVVADYQEKLEKSWIQSLREKYPVHINEAVLKSLVK